MTEMVGQSCDEGETWESWSDCEHMFGSMIRSMYTLFQVTSLESWSMAVARPIIEEQPALSIFFLLFLYVTTFGLMNVVMGVIVQQTRQSAEQNPHKLSREQRKRDIAE